MAAGGGGSWKVAYADFVTAMMAFFMVMWICSQDQQTREAVAHYFNEPFQFFKDPIGSNRRPEKVGAIFKDKSAGPVHNSDKVEGARGRETFSPMPTGSRETQAVSDWLHHDEKAATYWRGKAQEAIQKASLTADADGNPARIEEKATEILERQLETELKEDAPLKPDNGLYDDLLKGVLSQVNWS